jgi:hypothetical protein
MRIVRPFNPTPQEPRIYIPPRQARPYEDGGWLGVVVLAIVFVAVAAVICWAVFRR